MVEKREGQFYWDDIDTDIREAQKNNINIAFIINHPPYWAMQRDADYFLERFELFVEKAVTRYKIGGIASEKYNLWKYGISYWEIFNEPNLPGFGWGSWWDDPWKLAPLYRETLHIANNIIRKYDPQSFIILWGLSAHIGDTLSDSMRYLASLYSNPTKDCVDIIAIHPYGYEW
jgi:hypothetical protein